MPWDFLAEAAERSAAVAIVLDRTAPGAIGEVSGHLARMLTARGLKDSPLFTVTEEPLDAAGLLPATAVADISGWLRELGEDTEARNGVVRQTLDGAIRSLSRRTFDLADACQAQLDVQARLRHDVVASYDQAVADVEGGAADGTLLRGEVLARWQEFVGTGELLKALESKVSWLRDRLASAVKGKPQQAERVTVAVESGLQTLLLEHAEAAAERTDAVVALRRCRSAGARRQRRRPVAVLARLPGALRADGARLADRACSTWCAPRAATSAPPRASSPTASTGSPWP